MRNVPFTWQRLLLHALGLIVVMTSIIVYMNKPWLSPPKNEGWHVRNEDFPILFAQLAAPAETISSSEMGSDNKPTSAKQGSPRKLDINKATLAELETLPGIGPAKAKAILEYREQVGPFRSTEELLKVKGIGIKIYESVKEITIAEP